MREMEKIYVAGLDMVSGMPLMYTILDRESHSVDWIIENAQAIRSLVAENGALLLRGLDIAGSKQLSKVLTSIFDAELLEYRYRSTPRTQLRSHIYTTTEYHEDEVILQHNENSYSDQRIMRIGFYCQQPSAIGGETPIADSRKIYNEIPLDIREKFIEKKILYVRNYQDIDLPWEETFQTHDKADVEIYCKEHNIEFEWLANDGLRTKQTNPAAIRHPITNECVWFNQAHLFHVSGLNEAVKESMLSVLGEKNLPRNAYFGDGSSIPEADLKIIRDVYNKNKIMFRWEAGDLLLLDNILYSHGREPFKGARQVLVGMTA